MHKILLVGSVAFDIIFSLPQKFQETLFPESDLNRKINACFVAEEKQEFFGGTSGNIAAWLAKDEKKFSLFSLFGEDFTQKKYREKLEKTGEIRGVEKGFTAHAYMISDCIHQQFIIWQPNIYAEIEQFSLSDFYSESELSSFEMVVFSAGTPRSIVQHLQEFREKNKTATVFLDSGQVSGFFDEQQFHTAVSLSNVVFGNDMEYRFFEKFLGKNFQEQWSEKIFVETKGAEGVDFWENGKKQHFPAQKIEHPADTTGAGDAFRAGIFSAFLEKKDWKTAIAKGILWGAECVQQKSGQ